MTVRHIQPDEDHVPTKEDNGRQHERDREAEGGHRLCRGVAARARSAAECGPLRNDQQENSAKKRHDDGDDEEKEGDLDAHRRPAACPAHVHVVGWDGIHLGPQHNRLVVEDRCLPQGRLARKCISTRRQHDRRGRSQERRPPQKSALGRREDAHLLAREARLLRAARLGQRVHGCRDGHSQDPVAGEPLGGLPSGDSIHFR
mmetsp:Transcript_67944/g.167803  ORF Transcript_67944/g.167803 Transcript_67944/m.167803 type:complete len:202 (+) Transcript_67944:1317-1922(+)